jgi:hypothetical protein
MGPGIDDLQPNAVRIFGASQPRRFRFAVVSDHQLLDPSYRLRRREINGGDYPRRPEEPDNLAAARQGLAEMALLDPDFVLHLGDLTFGLDYAREYEEAHAFLRHGGTIPEGTSLLHWRDRRRR